MSRTIYLVVVLWLFSSTGFAQTDAMFVERVEAAADPHTLDQLIRQLPAQTGLMTALRTRADALFQSNEYERALRLNQAAASVAVRGNDGVQAARAYRALGLCYRRMGRQQDSLHANQEGLTYSLAAGDRAVSAELYRGVGLAERALGHDTAAIEAYQRSIACCEEAHDRECVLRSVVNLGGIYSLLGDFRRAAEVLQRGLTEASQSHSPLELGLLNNLAVVYGSQGETEMARVYFERELALARGQNATQEVALALTNLVPYYQEHRPELARPAAEEALRLAAETRQPRLTGSMLVDLAGIDRAAGRYDEAQTRLTAALKTFQDLGGSTDVAATLAALATLHLEWKHDAEALGFARQARDEARANGFVRPLWQALDVAGQLYRRAGRREEARAAFSEAVSLSERGLARLAGGEMEAHPFLNDRTDPYYALMEMAVEDGRFEEALQTLESAKARMLVDILDSGRADLNGSLTDTERRGEQSLVAAVDSSMAAAHGGDAAARARVEAAEHELEAFRASLYATHPELKPRRSEFAPFRLMDAADLIPDAHTALVDFALTGDRIYAFVLDRAADGKPSLTVTSSEWKAAGRKPQVEAFRTSMALRKLTYREQGKALYGHILGPIAARLRGKSVVGFVPDGVLWGAPLQALVQPNGRHLLEDYAIFYAPSLTALRTIRQHRNAAVSSGGTLLAFGAPAAGDFVGALAPLPESAREVARVAAVYGRQASEVETGAAARKSFWLAEAPRHEVLHLAVHGVLNTRNPLYSYMVLSDGVLEAREILNLHLNARLVVLSACETGLGNVSSGEGLVGMSWAFLAAGSSAAVVSQWKVDSTSTSELMPAFYRSYRSAGSTAAQALRRAALETMARPAFRHPYYWAGFVLMGAGD